MINFRKKEEKEIKNDGKKREEEKGSNEGNILNTADKKIICRLKNAKNYEPLCILTHHL